MNYEIDWAAEPSEWMRRQLDAAPPLSDRQRAMLAELLKPVRVTAGMVSGAPA
jgi:hypothetical protein